MKSIDHYLQERIRKNKKVKGLMKDEPGGKIMTEFAALRPKTYSSLMDDGNSDKKAKGTKKFVIKRRLKFNDYKEEEVKKIALSSNDEKRLKTFDRITSYSYGKIAGKVCKTEMLSKVNIKFLFLIIILMKIKQNIIQIGHTFQIIHTEYPL